MTAVHFCFLTVLFSLFLSTNHSYLFGSEDDLGKDHLRKEPSSKPTRNILIFGGNACLGSAVVDKVLSKAGIVSNDTGLNITIVNRGNRYWDSEARIFSRVTHISCERKDNLSSCDEFKILAEATSTNFDTVVDFSATEEGDISDALDLLGQKLSFYILVSSDAVYDVCHKTDEGRIKESVTDRLPTEEERDLFRHLPGAKRLAAEQQMRRRKARNAFLADDQGGSEFHYVILRLPDVIGPRETTYRWWTYQLWIRLAAFDIPERPVVFPDFLRDHSMSLVYSEDVSDLIADLIFSTSRRRSAEDKIFNLAWEEKVTTEQIVRSIHLALKIDKVNFRFEEDPTKVDQYYAYPSVRRAPLDVSKAQQELGWKPTPWHEATRATVEFYELAMKEERFATQRDEIIQVIEHEFYSKMKNKLYKSLEELYGIDLKHFTRHEEL